MHKGNKNSAKLKFTLSVGTKKVDSAILFSVLLGKNENDFPQNAEEKEKESKIL